MPLLNENPININGEIFGWAQVRVQLSTATIPFNLITAISYSDSREKEKVYGSGDKPIGTGYGNYSADGSITLLKDAMKALQNAAPQGDITLLDPFDVIVSYRSSAVDKITVDVLKGCEFTSNPTSVKQNDKSIEVELPLLVSQIKRDKNFVF
jgi:hypothetical protein